MAARKLPLTMVRRSKLVRLQALVSVIDVLMVRLNSHPNVSGRKTNE
jgi:hypothetical protein